TRCHRTPSGGKHFLFKPIAGLRSIGLDKLWPGVELKGDTGYACMPPSEMENGKRYTVLNDMDPAPMPEWLLQRINECRGEKGEDPVGDVDYSNVIPISKEMMREIEEDCEAAARYWEQHKAEYQDDYL